MEQLHQENNSWIRSLEFLKAENSYLKNRLSQVVDKSSDKKFLERAESFQNLFIIKDEFIEELKNKIARQDKSLAEHYGASDESPDDNFISNQEKLRIQMLYIEKDFIQLRNDFNHYLVTLL